MTDEPHAGAHWSFMAGDTGQAAAMRAEIRAFLSPCADQPGFDDAILAAHELISNAIEYGRGVVCVSLAIEGKDAVISVDSEGDSFGIPHDGALDDMDVFAPGGRGLIIARSLCPDIRVTRAADRTTVVATLPVSLMA